MKTTLTTPFFSSTFRALFINLTFAFKNCQNSFLRGHPLVHSGLENTRILEVKAVRLGFCPFDLGNIYIEENKKPGLLFLSS